MRNTIWPKLRQDIFTTYRFPRKDWDWQTEEIVQVVFKPRSNYWIKRAGE